MQIPVCYNGIARHIDREFYILSEPFQYPRAVRERLYQNRLFQIGEEFAVLCRFHHKRRIDHAVNGMFPTQQRLHPGTVSVIMIRGPIRQPHAILYAVFEFHTKRFGKFTVNPLLLDQKRRDYPAAVRRDALSCLAFILIPIYARLMERVI